MATTQANTQIKVGQRIDPKQRFRKVDKYEVGDLVKVYGDIGSLSDRVRLVTQVEGFRIMLEDRDTTYLPSQLRLVKRGTDKTVAHAHSIIDKERRDHKRLKAEVEHEDQPRRTAFAIGDEVYSEGNEDADMVIGVRTAASALHLEYYLTDDDQWYRAEQLTLSKAASEEDKTKASSMILRMRRDGSNIDMNNIFSLAIGDEVCLRSSRKTRDQDRRRVAYIHVDYHHSNEDEGDHLQPVYTLDDGSMHLLDQLQLLKRADEEDVILMAHEFARHAQASDEESEGTADTDDSEEEDGLDAPGVSPELVLAVQRMLAGNQPKPLLPFRAQFAYFPTDRHPKMDPIQMDLVMYGSDYSSVAEQVNQLYTTVHRVNGRMKRYEPRDVQITGSGHLESILAMKKVLQFGTSVSVNDCTLHKREYLVTAATLSPEGLSYEINGGNEYPESSIVELHAPTKESIRLAKRYAGIK